MRLVTKIPQNYTFRGWFPPAIDGLRDGLTEQSSGSCWRSFLGSLASRLRRAHDVLTCERALGGFYVRYIALEVASLGVAATGGRRGRMQLPVSLRGFRIVVWDPGGCVAVKSLA